MTQVTPVPLKQIQPNQAFLPPSIPVSLVPPPPLPARASSQWLVARRLVLVGAFAATALAAASLAPISEATVRQANSADGEPLRSASAQQPVVGSTWVMIRPDNSSIGLPPGLVRVTGFSPSSQMR